MKTKFNPNEPVTITNPLPHRYWPYKENRQVYYLTSCGYILKGKVCWFQPAYYGSCVVSEGYPTLTLRSFEGGTDIASLDDVRPATRSGYYELLLRRTDRCLAKVDHAKERLEEARQNFESCLRYARSKKPKHYRSLPNPKPISLKELRGEYRG